jgi:hypothetical protein
MSGNTVTNSTNKKSNSGIISFITQYDSLVIFGGLLIAILLTIIFAGIFVAGPVVRDSLLYNAAGAFLISFIFIYVIFKFMGHHIVILGKRLDFGMILYILIILFIIFILGN